MNSNGWPRPSPLQSSPPDFEALTEHRGLPMPMRQMSMAKTRYQFAVDRAAGDRMLEVACGTGFGADFMAASGRLVVAGDLMPGNLRAAAAWLTPPPLQFDAHHLPVRTRAFDDVVAFECLYYFAYPLEVLREMHRVLRPGGAVFISVPNPQRPGFHESPHAVEYFAPRELLSICEAAGFAEVELFGGFPGGSSGARDRLLLLGTRYARRFGLVPKDLGSRVWLKRVFFGSVTPFEDLRRGDIPIEPLEPIDPDDACSTVLYVRAVKPS